MKRMVLSAKPGLFTVQNSAWTTERRVPATFPSPVLEVSDRAADGGKHLHSPWYTGQFPVTI